MVLKMGLYTGIDAVYKHTMVQHIELFGYCIIPVWHGSNDPA